jgi:hypothetical protein
MKPGVPVKSTVTTEPGVSVESTVATEPGLPVKPRVAMKTAVAMKSTLAIETAMPVAEAALVGELPVVKAVVEDHSPVVPIGMPVAPTPPEAPKVADPKPDPEINSGAVDVRALDRNPARIGHHRRPIDVPGIVGRHVNDVGVCRFDIDALPLVGHDLLRRRL